MYSIYGMIIDEQNRCSNAQVQIKEKMMAGYLSGDVRERIIDLREERKLNREQLAEAVGISAATQGRIESGKTESISIDLFEKYMVFFDVSADFLLGHSNYKTRRNYDIEELKLTEKTVEAICAGKMDMEVINRLMENEDFHKLTRSMASYLNYDLSGPVAARNEVCAIINSLMDEHPRLGKGGRDEIKKLMKENGLSAVPEDAYDNKTIYDRLMRILRTIRTEIKEENPVSPLATKSLVQKMKVEMTKKKGKNGIKNLTADELTDVTVAAICSHFDNRIDEKLKDVVRQCASIVFHSYE